MDLEKESLLSEIWDIYSGLTFSVTAQRIVSTSDSCGFISPICKPLSNKSSSLGKEVITPFFLNREEPYIDQICWRKGIRRKALLIIFGAVLATIPPSKTKDVSLIFKIAKCTVAPFAEKLELLIRFNCTISVSPIDALNRWFRHDVVSIGQPSLDLEIDISGTLEDLLNQTKFG